MRPRISPIRSRVCWWSCSNAAMRSSNEAVGGRDTLPYAVTAPARAIAAADPTTATASSFNRGNRVNQLTAICRGLGRRNSSRISRSPYATAPIPRSWSSRPAIRSRGSHVGNAPQEIRNAKGTASTAPQTFRALPSQTAIRESQRIHCINGSSIFSNITVVRHRWCVCWGAPKPFDILAQATKLLDGIFQQACRSQ